MSTLACHAIVAKHVGDRTCRIPFAPVVTLMTELCMGVSATCGIHSIHELRDFHRNYCGYCMRVYNAQYKTRFQGASHWGVLSCVHWYAAPAMSPPTIALYIHCVADSDSRQVCTVA